MNITRFALLPAVRARVVGRLDRVRAVPGLPHTRVGVHLENVDHRTKHRHAYRRASRSIFPAGTCTPSAQPGDFR